MRWDRTGHNLLHTLYEQVTAAKIPVFEEFFVTSLITGSGRCTGCTAIEIMTGTVHGFASKAVLMATGGSGGSSPAPPMPSSIPVMARRSRSVQEPL